MRPTAMDLLNGCIKALAAPPRPEDAGGFATARFRTVALLNRLAAIEAAEGTAVRMWENTALRSLFAEAAAKYPLLERASDISDADFSLEALDAANAKLRRLLIELHEAAELASDTALDRTILMLYREIGRRRELNLPPVKPV